MLKPSQQEVAMADRRPLLQFRGDPLTLARLRVLERHLMANRTALIQLGLACLIQKEGLEDRVREEVERAER